MNQKAVIFGCGYWGQRAYEKLSADFDVAAYADNNAALWGGDLFGRPIIAPEKIKQYGDATVFVCVKCGFSDIARQLEAMGIPCVIWMEGVCFEYRDMVLYPVSLFQPEPYRKSGDAFSVLFVQDAPCGRTDKISSVLKARGVMTQNAFFINPSKMPEAYCKQNAFYSFDSLLEFVDSSDFDIVHCSNEPDILANLLLQCGKPVIYDAHDYMTIRNLDSTYETYYLEYAASKFADGFISTDEYSTAIWMERYHASPDRMLTVYNLPLESQIPANIQKKPKLSASDGELHLVYEGGISNTRMSHRYMEEIWRAIADAHVHVHYYSQQETEYCQALDKTSPYLHYEGNLSGLELIKELTQYDIGSLLLNRIDKNADIAYPNKLYEYFAAGLPVVSNLTASMKFVKDFGVGGTLDLQGGIQKQLREIAAIQVPGRFLQENRLTMDSRGEDILAFYRKICGLERGVEQ